MGALALPGKLAFRAWVTWRGADAAGSTRASVPPQEMRRNGEPNASSTITITATNATGRRITLLARRYQAPPASGSSRVRSALAAALWLARACRARARRSGRMRSAFTRGPSAASSAGSTVTAASTSTSTVATPPYPIERRKTSGNSIRLASAVATVMPDTATVRPAVAMVRATAASTESCLPSSSRNRLTMNRP